MDKDDKQAKEPDAPRPDKAAPAPADSQAAKRPAQGLASQPDELTVNRKGFIEAQGEITELLPGLKFRIELDTGQEIIATMKGRMRMHRIQLVLGDRVKVEMSPYDLTKGRIVYRQ